MNEIVAKCAVAEIERISERGLEPGLYVVSTPIGNLGDITLRALAVLNSADLICAEDTRRSGKLLSHFGIRAPVRAYHEHNAERERPKLLRALAEGQSVALVSDAGTPLISDPGYRLVEACLDEGRRVFAVPGAAAPVTALVAAGLPTDTFTFAGFLPAKKVARRARLGELAAMPGTLIFFEAQSRIGASLNDMAEVLGARPAAVARELTKLHEEVVRGTLPELSERFEGQTVKGELVVVVGPGVASEVSDADIVARLSDVLADASLRDAARLVANETGAAKSRVYDLALQVKGREP